MEVLVNDKALRQRFRGIAFSELVVINCRKADGIRCDLACSEPCLLAGRFIEGAIEILWEEYAGRN